MATAEEIKAYLKGQRLVKFLTDRDKMSHGMYGKFVEGLNALEGNLGEYNGFRFSVYYEGIMEEALRDGRKFVADVEIPNDADVRPVKGHCSPDPQELWRTNRIVLRDIRLLRD